MGHPDQARWWTEMYGPLRRRAARLLAREGRAHALQPSDLVHETYLRLAGSRLPVEDPAAGMPLALHVMRHVLIDRARRRTALRRGGRETHTPLHLEVLGVTPPHDERIWLGQVLRSLRRVDVRLAAVAEAKLNRGTNQEIGRALGVSTRTVAADWTRARRLLGVTSREPPTRAPGS